MLHTTITKAVYAGLLAAAIAAGCANQDQLGARTVSGTVAGVYVEAHPGVFIDRRLARAQDGQRVWVEVSFAAPLEDGRSFAQALVPASLDVHPGDTVEVRLADTGLRFYDLPPVHNTVTAIATRHGTPSALEQSAAPRPSAMEALAGSSTPRN